MREGRASLVLQLTYNGDGVSLILQGLDISIRRGQSASVPVLTGAR
jgi:hypothetical protein